MTDNHNLPELTDDILLAYLEGDVSRQVADRIEHSPELSSRAEQLSGEVNILNKTFHRAACPKAGDIGDYYLEILPEDQRRSIHDHLKTCAFCTRELAVYRMQLGPPIKTGSGANLLDNVKVFLATLADLTRPAPKGTPVFAFRGSETRLRVYQAEQVAITLDVRSAEETPDMFSVKGMVAGMGSERTDVMIWREDHLVETLSLVRGGFQLDQLQGGKYELVVRSGERVFYIASLIIP